MMESRISFMHTSNGCIKATVLVACAWATCGSAQVLMNLPTDHAGIVALQALQMKEETEFRKAPIVKDPVARLDGLADFIRQHPEEFETKGGIYNGSSEFDTYLQKANPDPMTLQSKLQPVQAALRATLPSFYSGMFDSEMARIFLEHDFDLPTAEVLAQSGVALFVQDDCLQDDRYAAESQHVYDESRAKRPLPFTYHVEAGEHQCARSIASRYAMLGKIQAKRGEVDAASGSFQKALNANADVDAALGLAAIDKAKGDGQGELEMFNIAFLTGALSAEDVKSARALYAKLNPGSTPESYDALLDARYAKTFANPVVARVASPTPVTPQHVVLEELFTGADCEPCVAPDLATEAVLHHYDRGQVVVVVYHDNAPGPDPLTTTVSEGRGNYYGTGGSTPHVIVDGKEVEIEEGPPSHAQSSFDIITKTIDPLLAVHPKAALHVTSQRKGDLVDVTVTGEDTNLPAKTHLQILLLETGISDTGKNTLRFHAMVVRAAAASKDGVPGLLFDRKGSFSESYSFDLEKVEADNLAYYDHYREGLESRMTPYITQGYMTKASVDKRAQFREPKNHIHRDRLAAVVFLQADDTKEVLQTSYTGVVVSPEGEK